jgi:hypothetical protein
MRSSIALSPRSPAGSVVSSQFDCSSTISSLQSAGDLGSTVPLKPRDVISDGDRRGRHDRGIEHTDKVRRRVFRGANAASGADS